MNRSPQQLWDDAILPRHRILTEPFITASVVSYKKEGSTGLGLAIARGLTELHGGKVTVASTMGVGSTFKVSIPVEPTADSATQLAVGTGSQNL